MFGKERRISCLVNRNPISTAAGSSATWATSAASSAAPMRARRPPAAALRDIVDRRDRAGRLFDDITVTELIARHLEAVKLTLDESTYRLKRRWLTEFAQLHGSRPCKAMARGTTRVLQTGSHEANLGSPHAHADGPPPLQTEDDQPRPCHLPYLLVLGHRVRTAAPDQEPVPEDVQPVLRGAAAHAHKTPEFQAILRKAVGRRGAAFRRLLRSPSATPGAPRRTPGPHRAGSRFVVNRHKTSKTAKHRKPRIIPFPPCIRNLGTGAGRCGDIHAVRPTGRGLRRHDPGSLGVAHDPAAGGDFNSPHLAGVRRRGRGRPISCVHAHLPA